jgi:hypothetical protein
MTTANPVAGEARRGLPWLAAAVVCVAGLTGVHVYRAATQSITHDEAVTYQRYVSGPLYQLVTSSDANNHILNSLLGRATVGLFGPAEFTLRLPSLAGGLLFLAMLARVAWRTWGPSPAVVLAVLLLGLNPFVMDYLSVARGYSLGLGLWVAALDQLLAAWSAGGLNPSPAAQADLHVRRASRLLALSVLGNLTFALPCTALAACWVALARRHGRRTRGELWRTLGRPGAVVFACLALPLVRLRPGQFYFGADSLAQSLASFVDASFAHHPQTWPWNNQAPDFQRGLGVLTRFVLPAVIAALLLLWPFSARGVWRRSAHPGEMLFFLCAGSFALSLGLLLGLHAGIGLKLPLERTGLCLVAPFGLSLLSAGSVFSPAVRSCPVLRGLAYGCVAPLCLVWAGQFQTDHYRPWAYESDVRVVFEKILAQHDPGSKQRLRVGANWTLVPGLNFYRDAWGADFVERLKGKDHCPEDADLYVIAARQKSVGPPGEAVMELYRGADSGTVVARPVQSLAAGGRRPPPSPPPSGRSRSRLAGFY